MINKILYYATLAIFVMTNAIINSSATTTSSNSQKNTFTISKILLDPKIGFVDSIEASAFYDSAFGDQGTHTAQERIQLIKHLANTDPNLINAIVRSHPGRMHDGRTIGHILVQHGEEKAFQEWYKLGGSCSITTYSYQKSNPCYENQTILHSLSTNKDFSYKLDAIQVVMQRAPETISLPNRAGETPAMLICKNNNITDAETYVLLYQFFEYNYYAWIQLYKNPNIIEQIRYSKPQTYDLLKSFQHCYAPLSYDETIQSQYYRSSSNIQTYSPTLEELVTYGERAQKALQNTDNERVKN